MRPGVLALVLLLVATGCQHAQPTVHVEATPGKACPAGDYPEDAPCLEAGQEAPHAGMLLGITTGQEWVERNAYLAAENLALRKDVVLDVGLIVTVGLLMLLTGFWAGQAYDFLKK